MDAVSEIKARLPIEELVGQYCQMQKKGKTFMALCPFHNDTKPSMNISPDKGIAYCFACRSGGDIFSFYQAIEGVDFVQALKDLAEKTGVDLPRQSEKVSINKDEKELIRNCLEKALAFYQSQLKESKTAQEYLNNRKLTPELIEKFEIGYAPDSFDATYTHLLKEGCSRSEIMGAGLGIQKDLQQERIYDRFRNRIIFPIRDHHGHIVGFGGRTIGEDDAKYINSPDGPLYNKSIALFGINLAKEAMRTSKKIVLVEGYFDVIAFHRIGIENVVAVSGTALTEQHVNILKRTAEKVIMCLDQDTAGLQAAERAFLLCKARDLDVFSMGLPTGKDPDECATLVPDEMKKVYDEGIVPYLDSMIARASNALKNSKADKRTVLQRLIPLLNCISSSVEQEEYMKRIAELLGTTVTALKDDMQREKEKEFTKQKEDRKFVDSPFNSAELLFGLILTYPDNLPIINKMLEPEGEKERALYASLKGIVRKREESEEAKESDDAEELNIKEGLNEHAKVLQLYCEETFVAWSASLAGQEIKKLCMKVNKDLLLKKQKKLIEEIRQAKSDGKKVEEEKLLTQYQQVLKLNAMT